MSVYDEVEIEDMTFDPAVNLYHFPCPCGDRFEISLGDLHEGEDIAICPSCSLMIRVIFEVVRTRCSHCIAPITPAGGRAKDKKIKQGEARQEICEFMADRISPQDALPTSDDKEPPQPIPVAA